MNEEEQKAIILEFLKNQRLGVISSLNREGKPESALVGYCEKGSFEILFGTQTSTRKYENLLRSPAASFLVWDGGKVTLQYEGRAVILEGEEAKAARELHRAKDPKAAKFMDLPDEVYFKISPTWIRYTDLETSPQRVFELMF